MGTKNTNIVVGFYSTNKVLNEAYKSFKTQLSSITPEFRVSACSVTDKVFDLLNRLNLDKLYISITSSDSLFFRFSNCKSDYEFKFEVFYDYDESDENDIESTLHVYKNQEKKDSYFGSIEYLFNTINELLFEGVLVYEINVDYAKKYQTTYSGIQKHAIPQNSNPYFQPHVNSRFQLYQETSPS